MAERKLTPLDELIGRADRLLRTLSGPPSDASRESPAASCPDTELDHAQRRHSAGLMRVNHTGEVCAQALYRGQALTANLPTVRDKMDRAAQEEVDHLVWCEERLDELGSHTSRLNPLWYGASFLLGAAAGVAGDRYSLGFVAATEEQVCEHLEDHLQRLPEADIRSRKILRQMLVDERQHGEQALEAGGADFPRPVKKAMTALSRLMTGASYRL
jgi:ubiquinone biosynthesis monooxygenase Coq7